MRLESEEIDGEQMRLWFTVKAPGLEEAQRRMEQTLVETEKFKATIEKLPGRSAI